VSRDLLIVLLVLGLAANVALVAAVMWINHRAASRPRSSLPGNPDTAAADHEPAHARPLAVAGEQVDDDALEPAEPEPAAPHPVEPRPVRAAGSRRSTSRGALARGATGVSTDPVEPPVPGRRARRFTMPEDNDVAEHARTERAIAAFLGEPVPADPEHRTSRRRHRARRAAGAAVPRTDLVVSLGRAKPDPRIVHALSAALRGTVRTSDQVVELAGGRLRITLEADTRGGDAFLRRAQGVVKPWLAALDPSLELRVEQPRTESLPEAAIP
jgi:hypothetical protein